MSRLKFSPNLFLEVNELNRLIKFLDDDGYKRAFKALVKSFGIVQNSSNSYFKTTIKPGSSNVVIINSGLAFDTNMNAIVMENNLEMTIANTGVNRWLILSRDVSNIEKGTVTVNSDGSLSGVGTEFLKVLRGQPNFPVKIKLNSSVNTSEYEVVNVVSDNSAVISGDFIPESGLSYSVIGTFTPGFQADETNKKIYEYDSYNIRIVDSADLPSISSDEFVLAKITFDGSGGMSVSDERVRYIFNNPYIQSSDNSDASKNPLASLLSVGIVGGVKAVGSSVADFELIIEHGYTITKYELITTSTSNSFNIITGQCNYLGSGNIPDGLFKGWLLLNRTNMKYVTIDDNSNKSLFITNFDSSIIEETNNDFIVIPNFNEIEYEVKISSNVDRPSIPFYFKKSVPDLNGRVRFYAYFPSVDLTNFSNIINVKVRYRMIDNSGKLYPYSNLAIAQFENVNGQSETLSESSFNINLADIEPQAKQRNYS